MGGGIECVTDARGGSAVPVSQLIVGSVLQFGGQG